NTNLLCGFDMIFFDNLDSIPLSGSSLFIIQKKHRLSENYLVSDVSIMIDAIELCDSDGFMDMEITKWNKDSGFGFAKNIYILKAFIHISQIPINYRKNDMEGFKFKGKYINNDTRGPKVTEIKPNSEYFD
ncbi:hypothetical protein, partial [Clostridium sp.]|uniref:hypothetical protein n=1 Tax=Clostridium sp. TaxID=1506 RepID=UPI003EEA4F63